MPQNDFLKIAEKYLEADEYDKIKFAILRIMKSNVFLTLVIKFKKNSCHIYMFVLFWVNYFKYNKYVYKNESSKIWYPKFTHK